MEDIVTPDNSYTDATIHAISTLEQDTAKLDQVYDKTSIMRDKLTTKLSNIIDKMNLDINAESSKVIEGKMAVVNTMAGLLNDTDKQATNHVKIKSSLKALDMDEQHSKDVIEFLKNIDLTEITTQNKKGFDINSSNDDVTKAFKASGEEILESELRTDASDLT